MTAADGVFATLTNACSRAGLDVAVAFRRDAWRDDEHPLPNPGRDDALGVLIGNTRRLWPHVRAGCAAAPDGDAIDQHVEASVMAALAEAAPTLRSEVVWAHHRASPFPMQRLAVALGIAGLAPCHLAIHPHHGPWWALRAVVLIDVGAARARTGKAVDVCTPCDKPCLAPFERALPTRDWALWLAVRDACPVGRAARYDDEQVAYHYRRAFGVGPESG